MKDRPLVVAYSNGRLVLMQQHDDCCSLKARADFMDITWQHEALVYTDGEVFFVLLVSSVPGSQIEMRYEAEAFLTKEKAAAYAIDRVSHAQGKVVLG